MEHGFFCGGKRKIRKTFIKREREVGGGGHSVFAITSLKIVIENIFIKKNNEHTYSKNQQTNKRQIGRHKMLCQAVKTMVWKMLYGGKKGLSKHRV